MRLVQRATDDDPALPEPEKSWNILQNRRKRIRSSTSRGRRVDRAAPLAKSWRDEHKLGDEVGGREPSAALDWWSVIANSAAIDLRKQKLYLAPLFLEAARAFFVYPGIVGVRRASLF